MCRHGLHHPRRCLSRHPQAVWPKDEAQNVPFQPPLNSSVHSLALLSHLQEESGTHLLFSSAMNTDSKDAWPSGSIQKVSRISPTSMLISGQKISQTQSPGQQTGKPGDGWARKSPQVAQCKARGHSRRGGHAASCCPKSQFRGGTKPEGHSQVCHLHLPQRGHWG